MSRNTSSFAATVQHRVLGVGFLVLLVVFAGLTYAIFNQNFVSFDKVSLKSGQIGLQLPSRADIKIRGVIVGEVLKTTTAGDGADIQLGIFPDEAHLIPAN